MLKLKKRNLSIEVGTEGPHHDPYSVVSYKLYEVWQKEEEQATAWIVTFVSHSLGFDELIIDGVHIKDTPALSCMDLWKYLTGMNTNDFQKYYDRINNPNRCTECRSKKLSWESGYPGEELLVCLNCKLIMNSTMNMAAII